MRFDCGGWVRWQESDCSAESRNAVQRILKEGPGPNLPQEVYNRGEEATWKTSSAEKSRRGGERISKKDTLKTKSTPSDQSNL